MAHWRLGVAVLLLLVVVCASGCNGLALGIARIPLYQRQYAQMKVGIPGRILTLRLRWDLDTNFLYDSPYSYSNTFSTSGSDIFFFSPGFPPVRLPVVYGQEPSQLQSPYLSNYNGQRQDTSGGVTYNGVLGLGPGSFIWRYWSSYTLSKFTLTLGAYDDVDVLTGSPNITSVAGFDARIANYTPENNDTLPFDFNPDVEFTYVPIVYYPEMYNMLFVNATHRILFDVAPVGLLANDSTAAAAAAVELTFWMSPATSVITNSYGGPEMALRIAERENMNTSEITFGRIHMLEDFVYFQDKITGEEVVQYVYDTYPAAADSQAAEGFLSLIVLALWCFWSLETASMTYQWTLSGFYPRIRQMCSELRNANLDWVAMLPTAGQKPIGEPLADDCPAGRPSTPACSPLSNGPVDWTMLSCMLMLTKLVCFVTVYCAIFGFHSGRFAEHLAKLAYLSPAWGLFGYYFALAFLCIVPVVVNSFFVHRYTYAGCTLVNMALLMAVWINRLPDTTSLFFSLSVNLLYGTLVLMRAVEWLTWAALRGSDSNLSAVIEAAREYPTDLQLAKQIPVDLRSTRAEVSSETTPLPRYRPGRQKSRQSPSPNDGPDTSNDSVAPVPDAVLLSRRGYPLAEKFLLAAWALVLLPCVCVWTFTLNILPMIENIFPVNPVRYWIAVFYFVNIAALLAWSSVCRLYLQILQNMVLDLKEAIIDLTTRLDEQIRTTFRLSATAVPVT